MRDDGGAPSPLLARHPMPDAWRCVLVVPAADPGLSGAAEVAAFQALRPATGHSALISQLVLTSLLPALVEQDVIEFGAALTRVQLLVGEAFAAAQGGPYHPQASPLVAALLAHGAAGAGQSSWGPTVYGIAGDDAPRTSSQPAWNASWTAPGASRSSRSTTAARAWTASESPGGRLEVGDERRGDVDAGRALRGPASRGFR